MVIGRTWVIGRTQSNLSISTRSQAEHRNSIQQPKLDGRLGFEAAALPDEPHSGFVSRKCCNQANKNKLGRVLELHCKPDMAAISTILFWQCANLR